MYQVDIILIHDNDSHLIEKYILKPINAKYYLFEPDNEIIINFKIIIYYIKYLYNCKDLYLSYIYSLIKVTNSKITLSFVDDSKLVFRFASLNNIAKHYAIQNGKRKRSQLESIHPEYGINQEKFSLDNYFCFGDYEKDIFTKYNHKINNYLPVGSLRQSISELNIRCNEEFDICLVSCWKEINFIDNENKTSLNKYVSKINDIIDNYLLRFLKDNSLNVIIALNGDESGKDFNYYTNLFGKKAHLLPRTDFSSYEAIHMSKVVISTFSTLVVEAFGIGKKIMFIDYSKRKLYSSYDYGDWFLYEEGYRAFNKKLNRIIHMDNKEWKIKTNKYGSYLMKYDKDFPTYLKIQNELKSQI
tara:strand:+ start:29092 stop:30165 length:1074 start_codon:yes stop_codon:yes gene_type:complete